ncbi:MAG: D-amino acid aminotransferase [Pseudomonadota bacterium]|nr:D-amino acid aminotransferase [Pseudomonadota bacterium]
MTTPPAIAYLNGAFPPLAEAQISPLDRGFLFADGVYEVIPVYHGRLFRLAGHLARLDNGLAALRLDPGLDHAGWTRLLEELVARNGGGHLAIYLQITRGAAAPRDHAFPAVPRPTVFAMCSPLKPLPEAVRREGLSAVTLDDIRWSACHLKTIALLPNVLARQQALDRGADDAILVRDGILTEAAAGNLFLVRGGALLTPLKDHRILPGITRDLILELAGANAIPFHEEDLPAAVLEDAGEVWITSSTKEILPVTRIDGRPVGDGRPGPLWRRLTELFQAYKQEVCPPGPP